MKSNSLLTLMLIAAVCLAESAVDAQHDTHASKPAVNAPTIDALLALEKQANEAYIKADSKFFEGLLSEKFVMREGGKRMACERHF